MNLKDILKQRWDYVDISAMSAMVTDGLYEDLIMNNAENTVEDYVTKTHNFTVGISEKAMDKSLLEQLNTRLEFLTYDLYKEKKRAINPNNVTIIALEVKINELKLLITTLTEDK